MRSERPVRVPSGVEVVAGEQTGGAPGAVRVRAPPHATARDTGMCRARPPSATGPAAGAPESGWPGTLHPAAGGCRRRSGLGGRGRSPPAPRRRAWAPRGGLQGPWLARPLMFRWRSQPASDERGEYDGDEWCSRHCAAPRVVRTRSWFATCDRNRPVCARFESRSPTGAGAMGISGRTHCSARAGSLDESFGCSRGFASSGSATESVNCHP